MNILSLCTENGRITPNHQFHDHCELFSRLEEWGHNFLNEPSAEPYYVFVRVDHGNFWERDTSPEGKALTARIKKDVLSKHAIVAIIEVDSFGVKPDARIPQTTGWVKNFAKFFNITVGDIIYVDAGYNIEHGMRRYGIKAFWLDWFQNYIIPDPYLTASMRQSIIDKHPRSKKFLYFGGTSRLRDHRLEFLEKAADRCNFRDIAHYSNAPGSYYDRNKNKLVRVPAKVLDLPEINHPGRQISNAIGKTIYHAFHADSYVNVVANSYFTFDPGRVELNEKLHKPMHCLQPFINLGEFGTLKALQELGYKTFGHWFDESYDTMLDEEERMEAVLAEVTRISNMSDSELSDMLIDMLPTLEHNARLVTERYYSDQGFHDFVAKIEAYRNLIISG